MPFFVVVSLTVRRTSVSGQITVLIARFAAISRLDGDEPDGDNSFADDFVEAMEDLDSEQWKEPGSSHYDCD